MHTYLFDFQEESNHCAIDDHTGLIFLSVMSHLVRAFNGLVLVLDTYPTARLLDGVTNRWYALPTREIAGKTSILIPFFTKKDAFWKKRKDSGKMDGKINLADVTKCDEVGENVPDAEDSVSDFLETLQRDFIATLD